MIYMFLSNNPSSGDINLSNLPCWLLLLDRHGSLSKKFRWEVGFKSCHFGRFDPLQSSAKSGGIIVLALSVGLPRIIPGGF